jgi:hypothetical protein
MSLLTPRLSHLEGNIGTKANLNHQLLSVELPHVVSHTRPNKLPCPVD